MSARIVFGKTTGRLVGRPVGRLVRCLVCVTSTFVLSHAPARADQASDVQRAQRSRTFDGPRSAAKSARVYPLGTPAGGDDRITVVADRDDDDGDGLPDAESANVGVLARTDLVPLDARYAGVTLTPTGHASGSARLIVNGRPLAWGERVPAGAAVQGVSAGVLTLTARQGDRTWPLHVEVHEVGLRDGARKPVDLARSHASIERTPPFRVDLDDVDGKVDDVDALRVVVRSPDGMGIGPVSIDSIAADGSSIDFLPDVRLSAIPCADEPGTDAPSCVASAPIRFVVDDVDRAHPLVQSRSIRAEVGGAIVLVDHTGKKLQAIRVKGPRTSSVGPIDRHRLTVRPVVMRMAAGSGPAVGGTDVGAITALRQELALASATWGQCGVSFGPVAQMDVKIVNPPPPYLVAIGDDVGLPASGGEIRLNVSGTSVSVTTQKGWSTRQVALELQRQVKKKGFAATLSENARIDAGASPSVDVAIKREGGAFASVQLVSSSDATLSVAVGSVDLEDGLSHFGDTDSVAGTLEERTLVKSVEDGDPHTIEVIVVPFFAGGGRIGESFIGSDGSSMRNVVILDRAGVRARRTSLTLAHELGHVILDQPGHPDDFGVDTPSLLMDSDASDASSFGPRRITVEECARAIRQSGPTARVPLLDAWKMGPLVYRARP